MNEYLKPVIEKLDLRLPDFECQNLGQSTNELIFSLGIAKLLQPRVIVEIGSAEGCHIYLLSALLKYKHKIISIDPWESKRYRQIYFDYNEIINQLRRVYPNITYENIRLISSKAREPLQYMLNGSQIDYLFLDGSHSYEDVLLDWKTYSDLVRGITCVHDVVGYKGAARAWKEIIMNLDANNGYRTFSSQNEKDKEPNLGLGVIFNKTIPSNIIEYINSNTS
jgi:precorrin-6B methylase 2